MITWLSLGKTFALIRRMRIRASRETGCGTTYCHCCVSKFNSDVDDALLRLATQAGEAQQVIEALAEEIACDCVVIEFDATHGDSRRGRRVQIDCRKLAGQPAIVVREVCKTSWREARWPLQAMGFREWQLLAGLVSGECARRPRI